MRPWLVLLLLALMQLSLSALAAAEGGGGPARSEARQIQAHRFSHCPHVLPLQTLSVARLAPEASADAEAVELDCAACHGGCAAALGASATTVLDPAGIERTDHPHRPVPPPWRERPYRPQWLAPLDRG